MANEPYEYDLTEADLEGMTPVASVSDSNDSDLISLDPSDLEGMTPIDSEPVESAMPSMRSYKPTFTEKFMEKVADLFGGQNKDRAYVEWKAQQIADDEGVHINDVYKTAGSLNRESPLNISTFGNSGRSFTDPGGAGLLSAANTGAEFADYNSRIAEKKAIDEGADANYDRSVGERALTAADVGWDNMVDSLSIAKFIVSDGDTDAAAEKISESLMRGQALAAKQTTGERVIHATAGTESAGLYEGIGVGLETAKKFFSNPGDAAVFTAGQAPNSVPTIVGGGAGAIAGMPAGPGGAVFGAHAGMVMGTTAVEVGFTVQEMAANRLGPFDAPTKENIKRILDSEGFIEEARNTALKKGLTVAAVDQVFLRIGGKVATGPIREARKEAYDDAYDAAIKAGRSPETAADVAADAAKRAVVSKASKIKSNAAAIGLDAAGETTGEALSQLVAYGEVEAGQAALEGLAGFPMSAVDVAIGTMIENRKRAQTGGSDTLDTVLNKVVDDLDIAQEEKGLLGLPEPTIVVTPDGVAATEANMRAAEEMGLRGTTMADTLGDPQIPGDGAVDFEQPDMTGVGTPERGTRGTGQFQNWEGNIPFEDQLSGEDSAMLADLRGMVTVARNAGDKKAEARAQAEVDNFLRNKLGGQDLSLTPLDNMTPIDGRVQPDNSIEFDQGDSYLDMDLDLSTDSTTADAPAPTVPPSGELVGQIDELRTAANETNSPFLKAKLNRDADLLQAKLDGETPKLSKEEAARKRKEYDATEEPLDMLIRKMGGLDTELESDYAGRFGHLNEKGKKNIENPGRDKGGMTLDDLLERANQEGFDFKDKADLEEALSRIEQGEPVWSTSRSSDSINYEALQNDRARLAQGEKLSPEDRALNETARLMDPDRYEKIIEPDDYKPSEKQIISELVGQALDHAPGQTSWVLSQDMPDAEIRELLEDILANEPEPKQARAGEDPTVFKQPYQYMVDQYNQAADEEGLTDRQRKRFTPEDTRDDVTGMYRAEDRIPTMNRAREYSDANNTEGSYVDIDLRNLGGLNAAFTHSGANVHFKAFADIIEKHLSSAENSVTFRHGGDEMSVIAPDVGVDDMTAAMAAAQAEIDQYVKDNNLTEVPHAKYEESRSEELRELAKGTGIYTGVSLLNTSITNSEIIELAEAKTEAQKPKRLLALMQAEKGDVNQQTTETTGTGQDDSGTGTERTGDPDTEGRGQGRGEARGNEGEVSATEIAAAAADATGHDASEAQINANNFKKGHLFNMQGFRISIENEAGTKRNKMTPKSWPPLAHHYGDLTGTTGADGDAIDVFIKQGADIAADHPIYVINQKSKDGSFDEHKVMMGFDSEADAKQGYLDSYSDDFTGFDGIVEATAEQLKTWITASEYHEGIRTEPFEVLNEFEGMTEAEIADYVPVPKTEKQGTYLSEKADPKRRAKGREGDEPANWSEEKIHEEYPELRFWAGDRVEIVAGGHSVGETGTVSSILTYETRPDMIQKLPEKDADKQHRVHYYVKLDSREGQKKEEVPVWADEFLESLDKSASEPDQSPVQAGLDLGSPEPTNDMAALRKKLENLSDKELIKLAEDARLRTSDGRENIVDRIIAVREGLKAIKGFESTKEIHAAIMDRSNKAITIPDANRYGQAVMSGNEKSGAWGTAIDKFVRWANSYGGQNIELSGVEASPDGEAMKADNYPKKMPITPQLAEVPGDLSIETDVLPDWLGTALIDAHNAEVKKLAKAGYSPTDRGVQGQAVLKGSDIPLMPKYLADPMTEMRSIVSDAEIVNQVIDNVFSSQTATNPSGRKGTAEKATAQLIRVADRLGVDMTPAEIIDSVPGLRKAGDMQAGSKPAQESGAQGGTEADSGIVDEFDRVLNTLEQRHEALKNHSLKDNKGYIELPDGGQINIGRLNEKKLNNAINSAADDVSTVRKIIKEHGENSKKLQSIKANLLSEQGELGKFWKDLFDEKPATPEAQLDESGDVLMSEEDMADIEAEFSLEQQTDADILADEAAQTEAQQQEREADRKAEADAQVDDFTLSGSDSAVDQAEARGQQNMLDGPVKESVEYRKAKLDVEEALNDLGDILIDRNTLQVVPIDSKKLLPVLTRLFDGVFRMGYYRFKDSARMALDLIREKFGDDAADSVKLNHLQAAYIGMADENQGAETLMQVGAVTSIDEIKAHKAVKNETATTGGMEQDSRPAGNESGNTQDSIQDDTGESGSGTGRTGRAPNQVRARRQGNTGVSNSDTAAAGKPGNLSLFDENGRLGTETSPTGNTDSQRGATRRAEGVQANREPEQTVTEAVAADRGELTSALKKQLAAEGKAVVYNDLDNIRETLPLLHSEQQEDVGFIEARLADNRGVLITNGTGTGKTFSGLGTVKRYVGMGKDNIIIAVPSQKIANDWIAAGELLNIDISLLEDTRDAGKGVVITTYSNFYQNKALAEREWDLVVADEAHTLSQAKSGEATSALNTLRAISGHKQGYHQYARMMEPELSDQIDDIQGKLNKLKNSQAKAADIDALEKQLQPLVKELHRRRVENGYDQNRERHWADQNTKLLMLSASPFAYEKSVDLAEGFLFEYGPDSTSTAYNTPNGREAFFIEHLGYRMRYGKLTEPEAEVDRGLMQREFNQWLKDQGALRGRRLDVDKDYSREFIAVDDLVGNKIDEGMSWVHEQGRSDENPLKEGYQMMAEIMEKKFDYNSRIKLLEAIKARAAVPRIKKHLAMGRQVVVFHSRIQGGSVHPFKFAKANPVSRAQFEKDNKNWFKNETTSAEFDELYKEEVERTELYNQAVDDIKRVRSDLVSLDLNDLQSPLELMAEEFEGQIVFFNGTVSEKVRQKNSESFNADSGKAKIIMLQEDAGATGISLHDVTGKHQRALVNLGLPVRPTYAIQIEGRVYRVGQMSDAIFEYFNTGTSFERFAFASKIAGRSGTAENLAMGAEARNFEESFIEAFEDPNSNDPHTGQGTGGKVGDKGLEGITSRFDKAKSYYFGTQKTSGRRDQREGADYFATPEPVALKMVEWSHAMAGEAMLEPSAGHGAIARFFPRDTKNTVVEPSPELASRAALRVTGDINQTQFEDLNITNKYDVIVMNPPYGSGGATSTAHLAKAMNHLNDGGRIVALLPEGPAADKKLDALLYGKPGELDAMKNRVKIRAVKQGDYDRRKAQLNEFVMVADISMPAVTFKRAGTSVKTHIVILERHTDMKYAPKQAGSTEIQADTVNELFDRIEHMDMPKRGEIPQKADSGRGKGNAPKAEKWSRDTVLGTQSAAPEAAAGMDIREGTRPGFTEIAFDGKPSAEIREKLKAAKYRWSPKNKVWYGKTDALPDLGGKQGGNISYSKRNRIPGQAGQAAGITEAEAISAIEQVEKELGNPETIDIVTAPTKESIMHPDALREAGNDQVKGYYVDRSEADGGGAIVLILEDLDSVADAIETLRHEWIAHHGLNTFSAKNKRKIINRIMSSKGEMSLKKMWEYVAENYSELTNEKQAEEVLAYMAENKATRMSKLWNDLVLMVQNFFKKMGWMDKDELTKAEVIRFIEDLSARVGAGAKQQTFDGKSATSYSKTPAADETGPVFYSQMQSVLEAKLPGKGTADQFKQQINNLAKKGEFKTEELEWSGVNEWLDEQTGKLSRDDVIDFIRANQIQIEEVVKGEMTTADENLIAYEEIKSAVEMDDGLYFDDRGPDGYSYVMDADTMETLYEGFPEDLANEMQLEYDDEGTSEGVSAFSTWQLPGGENYRELLLTLPSKQSRIDAINNEINSLPSANERSALEQSQYEELVKKHDELSDNSSDYTSKHWDEGNVLAHIRYNERTDADGKRVLFIEEIQSDWHQDGRKEGYGAQKGVMINQFGIAFDGGEPNLFFNTKEEAEQRVEHIKRIAAGEQLEIVPVRREVFDGYRREGVPDAPFKTTWPMLAMKRMIRHAAENGFDRIAWTTGEQQAERYDLSKQVDEVRAETLGNEKYAVHVYKHREGGRGLSDVLVTESGITIERVEELVGKELAEKISKQGRKEESYTGVDLKVGGEGMKGFYDQILPKAVNKYVKKWGAKVGETTIMTYKGTGERLDMLSDISGEEVIGNDTTAQVHAIDVTPSMKSAAMQGQVMYSKQSSAFKRWFGDSKVVDGNGDPLVVYHGTNGKFDSFIPSSAQGWGEGIYFTDNKDSASEFGENIIEAYVRIENPYNDNPNSLDDKAVRETKIYKSMDAKTKEKYIDEEFDWFDEFKEDGGFAGELLRQLGYDGIIAEQSNGIQGLEIVAFQPTQIKSATGNRGTFDPGEANIMYSKRSAGKAVSAIDQRAKGAAATVKHFIRRNLTKEGLMPDSAFEFKIGMDSEKNVGESEISFMVSQFQDDVAKAYGKKYNRLSAAELEEINSYLAGQKGIALPEGLHRKLDHMRAYLDRLSGGMQEAMVDMLKIEADQLSDSQAEAFGMYMATEGAEGYIPKSMQKHWNLYQTIEKNKGTYLTRSYQAFDEENWKNKVMMNHDLMRRAKEYIAEQNPELTPSEVHGAVGAILESAYENGNFMSFMVNGSKAGSKDTSIITKRKDVPPIIRELLGEYKDPKVNFTRSATKMQYFVANHHFLMGLRNDGMGTWLFERPTGEYDAQIAGEQSETMNPLNGLYTSRDIKQGLVDASGAEPVGDVMRELIRFNSMVKYGKTILAPTTQVRNFISAGMFTVMNGHFDYSYLKTAGAVAWSDMFTKDAEWKAYINNLVGLGVLHNNPRAGELKDALQDFIEMDIYKRGALQIPKKILDFAQRSYQLGDDFWKVVGFENEKQRQIDGGLSPEEAAKVAAYRIRNGYPTYSMVPRGIKKIRRWPLIGTFVSFPYEITRTSYNQVQFLKEDIAAGNTKAVAQRAVGISIAVSAAYAASVASMLFWGIDDDDDEAVRKLLPPWSRNSQLIYTGFDENGSPTYYDLSYVDPYTYLKKPISALMNGNNEGIDEKLMDASMEYLGPFIGIDIAAGVALEIASNKRMGTGSPIYNEQADSWDKTKAMLDHVRKGLQPGVMSNAERIILALNEQSSRSGRKYDLTDEMWALAGQRFGTLNIPQSMVYKSFQFSEDKAQASMLLSYVSGSGQKISESEVRDATNSMLEARGRVYKDMIKLVGAARRLGMNDDDLADIMEASGISRDDTDYLLDGEVAPWDMPFSYGEKAYTRSMLTAHDDARRAEIEAEMDRRLDIIDEILDEHYK